MKRKTQQRAAIEIALSASDRPLSPQEILEIAQAGLPGLGIATVYRTIKTLVEDGWLREVELPGEASRYELAGKEHHHHFHCRVCNRVFEVEDCPGALDHVTPKGFRLESHEIILYGLCATCSAKDS